MNKYDFLIKFSDGMSKIYTNACIYCLGDAMRVLSIVSDEGSELLYFDDISSIEITKPVRSFIE